MSKVNFAAQRDGMVDRQVAGRGVRSQLVLDAMRTVPREAFLPEPLQEFAYEDGPLPISEGQTISQPYIVALMTEALALEGGETVLEIGTGSGYAAAVLSRIARNVYTVERIGQLAEKAAAVLAKLGYANVHVLHADGTRGWPEHAPYDAIVVAAGGPDVPESLKAQLKIGGRLVVPVGIDRRVQELLPVIRVSQHEYETEDIADVRFVPLVGEEGWAPEEGRSISPRYRPVVGTTDGALAKAIATSCEKFEATASADLEPLLRRVGDARVVLLGEATHGTSEFYRMRERISRELIERKGFSFIAIEGDWPDAARVDHYVRHAEYAPSEWTAFARFPMWMWRNEEVRDFVDWLRVRNATVDPAERVAFHGLDLYSLYNSIRSVLNYLDDVDPRAARIARERYGCLTPWQSDPATYGHAALTGAYETCEREVVTMLLDLMEKRQAYAEHDGERFLDAVQNARLVANAERYYRIMYYGSRASWNLRDGHMFQTLKTLLAFHGPESKAIVWAHNSHVGDSTATEMSSRGEYNIGHLCRKEFGNAAYSIGFGTNGGFVAAASDWDGPMEVKAVRPALSGSYERLCHESEHPRFLLPLRSPVSTDVGTGLLKPRLERAIGVIYRPKTELESHYFQAILPHQFDEYIWFDETQAITPLSTEKLEGLPDTYPFGLSGVAVTACNDLRYVVDKLSWMRAESIWPNGRRYLWTDAFGVVLLVSLYSTMEERKYLDEAEWVVSEVDRVLGRSRGIRIGEAPERDGQYFHYLAMWLYALSVLGRRIPDYRQKGVELVRQIHNRFVVPDRGVVWKMSEDLSAPYPGYGFGALDAFDGYVSYRLLDEKALSRKIADMRRLIDRSAPDLYITQDLGLGMMLWMSQFFTEEDWARVQKARCLGMLDRMWMEDGYFCRAPGLHEVKFAFTNYGVSVGLQAVDAMPDRVLRLNAFFETYRSGDEYDREAITHVMACSSHFPGYLARSFG